MSKKKLLITSLLLTTALLCVGFRAETPREAASALLAAQVAELEVLYARGASGAEIQAVVARFDARVAPLLTRMSEAERASLTREVEVEIAGRLWGLN